MGSLMAGWDSPVPDPKSAKYLRNKSFTKEEIEAYWSLNKKTEEEHLRTQERGQKDTEAGFKRSNSFPPANISEYLTNVGSETDPEKIRRNNAWWTMSNWAFLNEPPVIETEGSSNKYASQYHLTNFSSSGTVADPGIAA